MARTLKGSSQSEIRQYSNFSFSFSPVRMSCSTLHSHRCPTCKSTLVNARNLVVFIDGTSNKPGLKETNIMNLYDLVSDVEGPELKQLKYYLEGVGVHDADKLSPLGRTWKRVYSGPGMAPAWKNVIEAYSWLARSYREGDQIYLFGFSQGAYQVQALTSMVHEVGLVNDARLDRIEQAYCHYLAINPNNPNTRAAATSFMRGFCWSDLRIHFVGIWDNVSSPGLSIKQDVCITYPASVTNVCHFRNVLVLDEPRVKFMKEYFLAVNNHTPKGSPRFVGDVKEVCFTGDSDGTSKLHSEGFSNPTISEHNPVRADNWPPWWMIQEATAEGLVFELERSLMVLQIPPGGPWPTELMHEQMVTPLLTSLFSCQQKTLGFIEEVLLLLTFNYRDLHNGPARNIPNPNWSEASIREQCGVDMFALTVILDLTSNFTISPELVRDAMESLNTILPFPNHPHFSRAVSLLRFSTWHPKLRQHFIAYDDVIDALMLALDWIAQSRGESAFPLIMDSLRCLINDNGQRDNVIDQLTARLDGTEAEQTRISLALKVTAPNHLVASLEMIALLASHRQAHCEGLKPRIIKLAKEARGAVGAAAVGALVGLNMLEVLREIHFSNVLGYLGNTLPRLDAEVGNMSSPDVPVALPPLFKVNGAGGLDDEDTVMRKLVQSINSRDAYECTMATFTLLKLCRYPIIQAFCSQNKVVDIFMKLSEQKKTSLLAAYALSTCLKLEMWKPGDFGRAARLIITMLNKGWFSDAVGRIEGSKILRELMASGDLRQQLIKADIMTTLIKIFEGGRRDDVCMGLICLDIFDEQGQIALEVTQSVIQSIAHLLDKEIKTQRSGVKVLSALAQSTVGEVAIKPRIRDMMVMLLHVDESTIPRSRLFGPVAALHDLCRNETLRKEILKSPEFAKFRTMRNYGAKA